MRRICKEAEAVIDYESLYLGMRMDTLKIFTTTSADESMCSAAVKAHPTAPVRPRHEAHPTAPVRPPTRRSRSRQ